MTPKPNLVVVGSLLFAGGLATCAIGGALGMSEPAPGIYGTSTDFTTITTALGLLGSIIGAALLVVGLLRR